MFSRSKAKIVAVADIGSTSAGVAILSIGKEGPSTVLVSERAELTFEKRPDDATITGVIGKLAEAGEKALREYAALGSATAIESSYAIIRAPWTRSKSVRVGTRFEEERVIDEATIGGLARQALEQDTELDHANLMEASVMRVEVNGYPSSKPEKKSGHLLSIAALLSDCEPTLRAGVVETMTRLFPGSQPLLRSGTRALLAVLRESEALPKDCIIVNMTAEATALIIVRKGVAAEQALVPEGANSIVRRIAQDKMPEETLALLRLFANDKCEDEACKAIQESVARVEPDIVRIFGEAMAKLAIERRLPNSLIIAASEDIAPWLEHLFSRIDFTQFTVMTRQFVPREFGHEDIASRIQPAVGVRVDAGLAVAAALVTLEAADAD